ncbi:copper chaperone [Acetomicrobium thermoterrenum DSM 13490]|jgi:copper chaperone|uniref:Heavy metal-associated domain protein n=2 Tax=Acetomicrobium TaxID=49894 RepID=A0A0T5X9Q0_9BACT|nr:MULTISPECIES: heavy metal-associated domain-containing protein [Acetomicrobium]KRT35030.1 heavy metal-associated domain protein [Acetomicrobium hydrogeniformans ATCC BAA-1850]SDY09588.1 copper chaperone [Acetomicrobium thermoterrenum DSM 13490]
MAHFILDVPDMSCQHCVKRISKTLEELGLTEFKVNLENKTVEADTDDIESVIETLDEIGYKATLKN